MQFFLENHLLLLNNNFYGTRYPFIGRFPFMLKKRKLRISWLWAFFQVYHHSTFKNVFFRWKKGYLVSCLPQKSITPKKTNPKDGNLKKTTLKKNLPKGYKVWGTGFGVRGKNRLEKNYKQLNTNLINFKPFLIEIYKNIFKRI